MVTIPKRCPYCRDRKVFQLDDADWKKWLQGMPTRYAFPELSLDDRERLKTGICPKCWDNMFGEDEPEWDGPEPAA